MAAECVKNGSVSARPSSIAIVLRIVMAAAALLSIVGCQLVAGDFDTTFPYLKTPLGGSPSN